VDGAKAWGNRVAAAHAAGDSAGGLSGKVKLHAFPHVLNKTVEQLKARALAEGVRADTIARMTNGLTPNPRVIALDNNQPGSATTRGYPPMSGYIATHVDAARIGGGRSVYSQHRNLLGQIEAQYGVPGPIIVAIFGHETSYGRVKGDFDLARSLAVDPGDGAGAWPARNLPAASRHA
jgi:membrane-bound lytic murein transglycosylase B